MNKVIRHTIIKFEFSCLIYFSVTTKWKGPLYSWISSSIPQKKICKNSKAKHIILTTWDVDGKIIMEDRNIKTFNKH